MASGVPPLIIDGSNLEGGGQLLRNSVALSALLCKPITVQKIRDGRKPPGLKAQHEAGLKLVAEICSAQTSGVRKASVEVNFSPGPIHLGKRYVADPGTAGAIDLDTPTSQLEDLDGCTTLRLHGGTNATSAPQIDYTTNVFLPFLAHRYNIHPKLKIIKRGFYPRGGGLITFSVPPLPPGATLPSISVVDPGEVINVWGRSYVAGALPYRIAVGMAKAAKTELASQLNLDPKIVSIEMVKEDAKDVGNGGSGSGIILWAKTDTGCVLGGSALGSKGTAPATVGKEAADELIKAIKGGGCVDKYLQDQIIVFLALAKGRSTVKMGLPLTLHTQTAIWLAERITGAKFTIQQDESVVICDGIGYTSQPQLSASQNS